MGTEHVADQRPLFLLSDGVSEAEQSKATSRAGHAGSGTTVAPAQTWRRALPLSPTALGGCAGHPHFEFGTGLSLTCNDTRPLGSPGNTSYWALGGHDAPVICQFLAGLLVLHWPEPFLHGHPFTCNRE